MPAPPAAAAAKTPWSRTNVACLAILAVALAIFAWQGLTDEEGRLREVQDYVITHSLSQRLVQTHSYFRDFTYALPAVIFKLAFAKPGLALSSLMWMAVQLAAAFAVARAFVLLLGRQASQSAYLGPLLAFVALTYCVQWDYRAVNVNMSFLALVLWSGVMGLRGRSALAALLLATSIALKLYSVALLPLLWLRGRQRELAWTGLWLGLYFVLIPALYFGPADAAKLTRLWLETLIASGQSDFVVELIAYKMSLHHVLLSFLSPYGAESGTNFAHFSAETIHATARTLQGLFAVSLCGFVLWIQGRASALAGGAALLADAGLLLLVMLFLSPLLEPHHGVLLLIPAAVMADVTLDRQAPFGRRVLSAGVLIASVVAMKLAPSGPWKGLVLDATIVVYAAATIRLRAARPLEAVTPR